MSTPTKKRNSSNSRSQSTKTATKAVTKEAAKDVAEDSLVSKSIRLRADQWAWLQEQGAGIAETVRDLVEAARQGQSAAPAVTAAPAEPVAAPVVELPSRDTAGPVPDESRYVPGAEFHGGQSRVYTGEIDWAVTKRGDNMARVVYEPAHENSNEAGLRRGSGRNFATWVFSEEYGTAEHLLHSGLELVIDTTLEPKAAIGLHRHYHNEEIYYLVDGSLEMTTVHHDGREQTTTLQPGDAHLIRPGQSHFCAAGNQGARFLTIAAKVR